MAFTGTAAFQYISNSCVRITGLSLGNGAAGTIGLAGSAGEVDLPAWFQPSPYKNPDGSTTDLAESIEVTVIPAGAAPNIVYVTKTAAPFLATLTNSAAGATSGALEIYVKNLAAA